MESLGIIGKELDSVPYDQIRDELMKRERK
jgi:hypothetical protein